MTELILLMTSLHSKVQKRALLKNIYIIITISNTKKHVFPKQMTDKKHLYSVCKCQALCLISMCCWCFVFFVDEAAVPVADGPSEASAQQVDEPLQKKPRTEG